jgi:hypothetical protein
MGDPLDFGTRANDRSGGAGARPRLQIIERILTDFNLGHRTLLQLTLELLLTGGVLR